MNFLIDFMYDVRETSENSVTLKNYTSINRELIFVSTFSNLKNLFSEDVHKVKSTQMKSKSLKYWQIFTPDKRTFQVTQYLTFCL